MKIEFMLDATSSFVGREYQKQRKFGNTTVIHKCKPPPPSSRKKKERKKIIECASLLYKNLRNKWISEIPWSHWRLTITYFKFLMVKNSKFSRSSLREHIYTGQPEIHQGNLTISTHEHPGQLAIFLQMSVPPLQNYAQCV